jgi:hypothetical protein
MFRNVFRKLMTEKSRAGHGGWRARSFRPRLETLEDRLVPSAATRPIADFLSTQGTTSVFPNGIDPSPGPAGLPDELGWSTSTATFNNGTAAFARMDYTGQDAAFLGLHLGTTTSGTISEVTLADGTARDTVNLHTHNAFAWAENFFPTPTLTFGYLPSQLAANAGLVPPVGDCNLQAVIDIPHPGAPLPDLVKALILGQAPGDTVESFSFRGTASGPTPSGAAAQLVISETGVLGRTPNLIADFGFTAEVVSVKSKGGPTSPAAAPQAALVSNASPSPSPSLRAVPTAAVDAVFGNLLDSDPLASAL